MNPNIRAWLRYGPVTHTQLQQCRDEGKYVEDLVEWTVAIAAMAEDNPEREVEAIRLFDESDSRTVRDGYHYIEPSHLEEIGGERPSGPRRLEVNLTEAELADRIYGAWLGRCAGCLLGKPVEGWRRDRLVGFNRAIGNYPVRAYMTTEHPSNILQEFGVAADGPFWANNVSHGPEDDDTNYTVMGLKILERHGLDFRPADVAETWLVSLPIVHLATAERIAYRNLVNLIDPPESASFRNAFREWIGAQIRADHFGYVNPGWMERAAEMAWRDASISHIKNGIYGEMWVAAMLAAATVTDDIEEIIRLGLSEVPANSRFAEALNRVLDWPREGLDWEQALDRIHEEWDESNQHHWCHTISNAMIVALALLYGESDYGNSIGIAVIGGLDTDCNGATVGSVVGMMLGAKALPDHWLSPLNDNIATGVHGYGMVRISDLAQKSMNWAKKSLAAH